MGVGVHGDACVKLAVTHTYGLAMGNVCLRRAAAVAVAMEIAI